MIHQFQDRMVRLFVTLLAAVALGGCGLYGTPTTLFGSSELTRSDDRLYFCTRVLDHSSKSHHLYCVDADTGEPVWAIPFPSSSSDPVLSEGRIYVGATDGCLYCLDASDGTVIWRQQLGVDESGPAGDVYIISRTHHVNHTPVVDDGMVYVRTWWHFNALDVRSGKVVWRIPTRRGLQSRSTVNGEHFVQSSRAGHNTSVVAIDRKTGVELWSIEAYNAAHASLNDGVVFWKNAAWAGEQAPGRLYALDARSGREKWIVEVGGKVNHTLPVVSGGQAFFSSFFEDGGPHSGSAHLYAVDVDRGEVNWEFDAPGRLFSFDEIMLSGDMLYCSNGLPDDSGFVEQEYVLAFDQLSGELKWSHSLHRSLDHARTGRYLYLAEENSIIALDHHSGEEIWSRNLGNDAWIRSVIDGTIYVTVGAHLEAIDERTGDSLWKFPLKP